MKYSIILLCIIAVPAVAFSATIYVPEDYLSIQEAINHSSHGDLILAAPGTYLENIDYKGKFIEIRSDVDRNPSTFDLDKENTIIDGGNPSDPNQGSVVTFSGGENNYSVLRGFTLTNGSGNLVVNSYCGGGIYCENGGPTIKDNIVKLNVVDRYGGGIYCREAFPRIRSNIIRDNEVGPNANDTAGGGICCVDSSGEIAFNTLTGNGGTHCYGGGISCSDCSISIVHNTIEMNSAIGGGNVGGEGGGLFCNGSGTAGPMLIEDNDFLSNDCSYAGAGIFTRAYIPTIQNNLIQNNASGRWGGGISVANSYPTIKGNTIVGNTAGTYHGGGIWCSVGGADIIQNVIEDNHAEGVGGGIACASTHDNHISFNSIIGNSAHGDGGGLFIQATTTTVSSNFVFGNFADNFGGGMACQLGSEVVVNNIITMNTAAFGGGIASSSPDSSHTNNTTLKNSGGGLYLYNNAHTVVSNSIFWQNSTPAGYEIVVGEPATSPVTLDISYSVVEGGQSAVYGESGSTLNWGGGMKDADPLFVDVDGPDDNLWTWEDNDLHLSVPSPCIDAGDNAAPSLPATDFEGDPRIIQGLAPGYGKGLIPIHGPNVPAIVDMGADEYCRIKFQKSKNSIQ